MLTSVDTHINIWRDLNFILDPLMKLATGYVVFREDYSERIVVSVQVPGNPRRRGSATRYG
jgi:hypothetical protein